MPSDPPVRRPRQKIAKRWAIRVISPGGRVMYLRHSLRSGAAAGDVVRFRVKKDAELNVEFVQIGLDEHAIVQVVDASEVPR